MAARYYILLLLLVFFTAVSCERTASEPVAGERCVYENDPTILAITNRAATVMVTSNVYQLKLNASDTILNPCILNSSCKIAGLQVLVSGNLKPTAHNAYDPCRCYNFVITGITH